MQYGGHAEEALEALASHASSVRYRSPVEDSESHRQELVKQPEAGSQILNRKARSKCHRCQTQEATVAQALELHGQLEEGPLIMFQQQECQLEQTNATNEAELESDAPSPPGSPIANEAEQNSSSRREKTQTKADARSILLGDQEALGANRPISKPSEGIGDWYQV